MIPALFPVFSVAFSPLNIAGCVAWYDAADATSVTPGTSSSSTSLWNDKSGGGQHVAQGTGILQPTYVFSVLNSKNIMRFNGLNVLTRSNSSFLASVAGWTLIVLSKPTGFTTEQAAFATLFASNSVRAVYSDVLATTGFSESGGRRLLADARSFQADTTVRSTSSFQMASTIANFGGTMTLYLNNVQTVQKATYASSGTMDTAVQNIFVGCDAGSTAGNDPFTGDIAEIIVYNNAISTSDQTKVYNYLVAKWAF